MASEARSRRPATSGQRGEVIAVWSIPVSGGSSTSLYTLTGGGNSSLALLLPNLYVTSAGLGRVVSVAVAAGGWNGTVDGAGPFHGVDARAGRIAWFAGRTAIGAFDGVVKGMSVGGSPTVIASGQAPWAVAVDGTNAYWVTESGNSQEALYKAPVGGGSATLLLDNVNTYSIAIDDSYVYFLGRAGWGSNGLFRTPK